MNIIDNDQMMFKSVGCRLDLINGLSSYLSVSLHDHFMIALPISQKGDVLHQKIDFGHYLLCQGSYKITTQSQSYWLKIVWNWIAIV